MTYQYISPLKNGFVRVPVARREHNRLLPNRQRKFGVKVEYYWHAEKKIFEAEYFTHWWMKVFLIVVMFIPSVVMQGAPETIRDLGNCIHERKRGKFSADRSFLREDRDSELLAFLISRSGGNS